MRYQEIKHFHPDGELPPNGSHYQRGGYMKACRDNWQSFAPCLSHQQPTGHRGGMVVFPTGASPLPLAGLSYSEGGFRGRYVSESGVLFNEHSVTLEFRSLSSHGLKRVAAKIRASLRQETFLIKDFNNNKIYLACPRLALNQQWSIGCGRGRNRAKQGRRKWAR